MDVVERRRPDIRRFGEPVRRVGAVTRLTADALEEHRVRLRVFFARFVCVRQRLLVVRIFDETLHEPVDLGAIHTHGERTRIAADPTT